MLRRSDLEYGFDENLRVIVIEASEERDPPVSLGPGIRNRRRVNL